MKRTYLIKNLTFLLFLTFGIFNIQNLSGQDKIVKRNGEIIDCEIISIDSVRINIVLLKSGQEITTHIDPDELSSFTWRGILYDISNISLSNLLSTQKLTGTEQSFADSIEKSHNEFIITFDNKVIPVELLVYHKPLLGYPYLIADLNKHFLDEVKFYKDDSDIYANCKNLSFMEKSTFAIRIKKGRLNVFEKTEIHYHHNISSTPGVSFSAPYESTSYFYNKGFEDLKKINYGNLIIDLSDNLESLSYLDQFKRSTNTQIGLIVAGVIIIAGTSIAFLNAPPIIEADGSKTYGPPNFIGLGLGFGCLGVTYIISKKKTKNLLKAIAIYNI